MLRACGGAYDGMVKGRRDLFHPNPTTPWGSPEERSTRTVVGTLSECHAGTVPLSVFPSSVFLGSARTELLPYQAHVTTSGIFNVEQLKSNHELTTRE